MARLRFIRSNITNLNKQNSDITLKANRLKSGLRKDLLLIKLNINNSKRDFLKSQFKQIKTGKKEKRPLKLEDIKR